MLNFAGPEKFTIFAGLDCNNEYSEFSDSAGPISTEDGGVVAKYDQTMANGRSWWINSMTISRPTVAAL
jgi:hypothetical protein